MLLEKFWQNHVLLQSATPHFLNVCCARNMSFELSIQSREDLWKYLLSLLPSEAIWPHWSGSTFIRVPKLPFYIMSLKITATSPSGWWVKNNYNTPQEICTLLTLLIFCCGMGTPIVLLIPFKVTSLAVWNPTKHRTLNNFWIFENIFPVCHNTTETKQTSTKPGTYYITVTS